MHQAIGDVHCLRPGQDAGGQQIPMFDAGASTGRLSPSSASAAKGPSSSLHPEGSAERSAIRPGIDLLDSARSAVIRT